MYRRILIATDGSEPAQSAAREGIRLARLHGAVVVFYYVIPPYSVPAADFLPFGYPDADQYADKARKDASRSLARVCALAKKAHVTFEAATGSALDAAADIASAAQRERCDLIVIGSHGRGAFQRLLLGSVVTRLITLATQPVLVCKTGGRSAAGATAAPRRRTPAARSRIGSRKPRKAVAKRTGAKTQS